MDTSKPPQTGAEVQRKITSTELYERVKSDALEHDSHESDLYLRATPEARALLARYEWRANVTTFISQIDGKLWYDVPFAYTPFWNKRTISASPRVHT